MRIISRFHDYYDSILSYGADPKLVYLRKEKEMESITYPGYRPDVQKQKENFLNLVDLWYSMPSDSWMDRILISFCGKAYPGYQWKGKIYYDLDKLISAVELAMIDPITKYDVNVKGLFNRITRKEKKRRRKWVYRSDDLCISSWNRYLQENDFTVSEEIHRYWDAPVLIKTPDQFILNGRLRDFDFQSIVDPWTAYQELSMYMGSALANQVDPEVKIPDKLRAESHGFDEYSFRRLPTKKK